VQSAVIRLLCWQNIGTVDKKHRNISFEGLTALDDMLPCRGLGEVGCGGDKVNEARVAMHEDI
jgi:hypothetical protein